MGRLSYLEVVRSSLMNVTLRLSRRASYADYLAVERNGAHRHEPIDGVILDAEGRSLLR